MIIALDFDGTLVTHEYPYIGKPLPLAKEVVKLLSINGHELFLYTMRDGVQLEEAKTYCIENGLPILNFNESPAQFSTSPKQYAQFYIDDAALGCPLKFDYDFSYRPFVDWRAVAQMLCGYGLITKEQLESLEDVA